jgi:ubiquinone/menaquinone biosynthesis C-methylase UbiE
MPAAGERETSAMSLRGAWDTQAERWIRWAREPGLDSYWRFHGRRFLELLPDPGQLTLDVGGGEGRVGRDLRRRGHRVVQIDASMAMSLAAATHDEPVPSMVADAARLPIGDGTVDLVVAFMSLHDIDDLHGAVAEIARVLVAAGRLCLAVVHPMNSSGHFSRFSASADSSSSTTTSRIGAIARTSPPAARR